MKLKTIGYEDIIYMLESKYIEYIEDLGLSPEEILVTLLVKAYSDNEYLKNRLGKYENY